MVVIYHFTCSVYCYFYSQTYKVCRGVWFLPFLSSVGMYIHLFVCLSVVPWGSICLKVQLEFMGYDFELMQVSRGSAKPNFRHTTIIASQ